VWVSLFVSTAPAIAMGNTFCCHNHCGRVGQILMFLLKSHGSVIICSAGAKHSAEQTCTIPDTLCALAPIGALYSDLFIYIKMIKDRMMHKFNFNTFLFADIEFSVFNHHISH